MTVIFRRSTTNKQAKQNQRHGNKEQTDSDQRGEGREIRGERRGRGKPRNTNRELRGTDNGGRLTMGLKVGMGQGREQWGRRWNN